MAGRAKGPTILLLDNDPLQLKTWKDVVRKDGYKVIDVGSQDDARAELASKPVDLALIDLRLLNDKSPVDFSGIDFAKTVDPSIPRVILTDHPNLDGSRAAMSGGDKSAANYYVSKKEGSGKVLKAVRDWLRPRVFLVHGHDGEALLNVKELIKDLGLWPIIMKDEPAGLVSLLQHFQRYSNAGFAVVIATPDDVGYRDVKPPEKELRARQNVVFEFGFFCAKLPPERIVLLIKDPKRLKLPSDVVGTAWIELDPHGGWKSQLTKVLKKADLKVSP